MPAASEGGDCQIRQLGKAIKNKHEINNEVGDARCQAVSVLANKWL